MLTINTTYLHDALKAAFSLPCVFLTAAVIIILTAIAIIDFRTRQIPLALNIALLVCGIPALMLYPDTNILSRFLGMLCISLPLFVIALAKRNSVGMGDIKLMAASGFLLGPVGVFSAFAIGSVLGGIYGTALLIFRKATRNSSFAFAPCLCIGILASFILQYGV